jgi:uncharacterized LabA/DUF88 family protein
MRVSAVQHGMAPDIWSATDHKILDYNWKIDFGRLFEFAGGDKSEVGRAVLYGSRPPRNDSLWSIAERKGFEVVVQDRSISNKEKKIDTGIATDIVADSYELMDPANDEITLVAGDSDYVPTVERMIRRGFKFYVIFWNHASRELREACTKFYAMDPHLEYLRLK